ncbi:hypothetical protein SAMN04488691_103225 [Haloferax larsenii]|uniref:Uncharacterized protein n=1 Tax=Haloferax larsenii TaxID=302484 RepID=A0A1H7N8L0_HALLR|nr:hypothetical protein SAMN04488691_103225 [Haloferax larsenii]
MKRGVLVTLAVLVVLAGCTGAGPEQTATDNKPASVSVSGKAPSNIEAYYVTVDGSKFLCIEHLHREGAGEFNTRGFYGLSCTPVESLNTTAPT